MKLWFNRQSNQERLAAKNKKTRDYYFIKNEEQLHREKISLEYDLIRSLAR
ncbi:hypothetical protein JYK21_03175 [Ralstonia pickettii]|nr:hypothetical protein [Ralstonia pickettii]